MEGIRNNGLTPTTGASNPAPNESKAEALGLKALRKLRNKPLPGISPKQALKKAFAQLEALDEGLDTFQLEVIRGYEANVKDHFASKTELDKAKVAIQQATDAARTKWDTHLETTVAAKKVACLEITKAYNQLPKDSPVRSKYLRKITLLSASLDLPTSSRTIVEARMQKLKAVYQKKLALWTKKFKLDAEIKSGWFTLVKRIKRWSLMRKLTGNRRNKVRDLLDKIEKSGRVLDLDVVKSNLATFKDRAKLSGNQENIELLDKVEQLVKVEASLRNEGVNSYHLQRIREEIERDLEQPVVFHTTREAKRLNRQFDKELEWADDYLNLSLAKDDNWFNIHRFTPSLSAKTDNLYIGYSHHEPLSTVPAGLRNKRAFKTRATNFFKTTHYLLGAESKTKAITYRGGQWPTVEAAIAALKQIKDDTGATNIHISVLLTPTALPGNTDRQILKAHLANIRKAAAELGITVHLSNFGVNEGAIGRIEVRGMELRNVRLGHHTSVSKYNNAAARKLNQLLKEKLNSLTKPKGDWDAEDRKVFNHLDAIVKVGQEMESIWAQNGFTNATEQSDQFRLPALWSVMDNLLGITSYLDCRSGKDRTGEVDAAATAIWDELAILSLEKPVEPRVHAFFDTSDHKVGEAKKNLFHNDGQFLKEKTVKGSRVTGLKDHGISKNRPLNRPRPALTIEQAIARDWVDEEYYQTLKTQHYEKFNRRASKVGSGGLRITEINTGKPGFLVKGGDSMAWQTAGFDRNYVILKLLNTEKEQIGQRFAELTGLDELSLAEQRAYDAQVAKLPEEKSEFIETLGKVLRNVARSKAVTCQPKAPVKA